MGKIIFPFKDKEEPIKKVVDQKYMGYGYWMRTYSDGSRLLIKDRGEGFLPLSKAPKFDDQGYPKWVS